MDNTVISTMEGPKRGCFQKVYDFTIRNALESSSKFKNKFGSTIRIFQADKLPTKDLCKFRSTFIASENKSEIGKCTVGINEGGVWIIDNIEVVVSSQRTGVASGFMEHILLTSRDLMPSGLMVGDDGRKFWQSTDPATYGWYRELTYSTSGNPSFGWEPLYMSTRKERDEIAKITIDMLEYRIKARNQIWDLRNSYIN
jgi:hypothetical protein